MKYDSAAPALPVADRLEPRPKHQRPRLRAPDPYKADLAQASRRGRELCGVNQEQLASHLGIDRAFVSRAENPRTPDCFTGSHIARAPRVIQLWGAIMSGCIGAHQGVLQMAAPADKHGENHDARLVSLLLECSAPTQILAELLRNRPFKHEGVERFRVSCLVGGEALQEAAHWAAMTLLAGRFNR